MKYIVGFSGGIDSQAAANWALDRLGKDNVILLNSNAGRNEHALTTEFIAWYSENVHHVEAVNATYADLWRTPRFAESRGYDSKEEIDFADMAAVKGRFPSRRAQFCTDILKLRPMKRWLVEHAREIGSGALGDYERVTGLRRDESDPRRSTPPREWDDFFECFVNHPLAFWTKDRCFADCRDRGQRINPLYTLGFARVGCAPCVNSSRADVRNWAKRFPEVIDKLRAWEHRVGRTFFPPLVPGKEVNWIDEVVEWANCERGGTQYSLEVIRPAPVCESIYGLCE